MGHIVGRLKDDDSLRRSEGGIENVADVRRRLTGHLDRFRPFDRVKADRAQELEQALASGLVAAVDNEHLPWVYSGRRLVIRHARKRTRGVSQRKLDLSAAPPATVAARLRRPRQFAPNDSGKGRSRQREHAPAPAARYTRRDAIQ